MAATLNLYAYTAGNTTSLAGSAVAINTDSALSFGGGTREQFQYNITINTYNTAMHYAKNTDENSTDYCTNTHLTPITYTGSTGCAVSGVYQVMADGTPKAVRGLCAKFTYDSDVKVNPGYAWAGSGANVDKDTINADIQLCDLTSANPTWREATSSGVGKLALKVHGEAAQEHWWSLGISIKPTAVGFNNSNKIKIELTYY